MSIILNELIRICRNDFKAEIPIYLFSGSKSKLKLNNETEYFYIELISNGITNVEANGVHQKRIFEAYTFLKKHILSKIENQSDNGEKYLVDLFDAIIRKLNFSYYPIEIESEIGMTFELMNSRGKDLSYLELLKNYLMYWVYRNIAEISEKDDFTNLINRTWKDVYINIAKCNGSESQCLRIAWTLYVNYTPKNWEGYSGFKSDDVIPLRNFSNKSKEEVKSFLLKFINGFALISKHYAKIIKPDNTCFDEIELSFLKKIRNSGYIASYLPLMISARIKRENYEIENNHYIEFLKSIELYSYRVFLWEGIRSNAGLSKFYRWGDEIFTSKRSINSVTELIYETINWYSPENGFRKKLTEDYFEWYQNRRLLKYTLFEYEHYLLKGSDRKIRINWEDLTDSTIEHILPQKPDEKSNWIVKWTDDERKKYLHDISNLVLTRDNSRYSNFEFEIKKGKAGSGYCYSNSDIRQERKIAEFEDWTPESCKTRRVELIDWIILNWGIHKQFHQLTEEIIDEDEEIMVNDIN